MLGKEGVAGSQTGAVPNPNVLAFRQTRSRNTRNLLNVPIFTDGVNGYPIPPPYSGPKVLKRKGLILKVFAKVFIPK
jgi:hypothetical protein